MASGCLEGHPCLPASCWAQRNGNSCLTAGGGRAFIATPCCGFAEPASLLRAVARPGSGSPSRYLFHPQRSGLQRTLAFGASATRVGLSQASRTGPGCPPVSSCSLEIRPCPVLTSSSELLKCLTFSYRLIRLQLPTGKASSARRVGAGLAGGLRARSAGPGAATAA